MSFPSFPRSIHILTPSIHSLSPSHSTPAIREYDAKLLLAYWLERAPPVSDNAKVSSNFSYPAPKVAQVSWDPETDSITSDTQLPSWVFSTKLVAKPDQLIKRRGKAGLLALNKTWDEAKQWIQQRAGKPQKVCTSSSLCLIIYAIRRISIYPSIYPSSKSLGVYCLPVS